jgi:hypothetical protein
LAFHLARLRPSAALPVWYITDEDGELTVRSRLDALLVGHDATPPETLHVSIQRGIVLDDPAWQQHVIDYVRIHQIALVIIDPIRASSGAVDQGPRELKPLRDFFSRFLAATGATILLGHHDVKPPVSKTDERAAPHRASGGGIFSVIDCPIHAERLDAEATQALLTPSAYKLGATPPPLLITLESNDPSRPTRVTLTATEVDASDAGMLVLQRQVEDYVRRHPGHSGSEVAKGLGRKKNAVLQALDLAFRAGTLDYVQEGQAKRWCARTTEPTDDSTQ